jgi:Second Messenger Oligonucleotide or Dinucleotide Synthetase domain
VELGNDFKVYLSSIQPGDDEVAAAKAAHEQVRDELRTDSESKDAHEETFLSGSYARRTAINDINDVDVICILDIDHTITPPDVLLGWVERIMSKYYKEVRPQGRSIGAAGKGGVWLDVVPATPVNAADGPLWIPDRQVKQWVQTHPKGQIAAGIERNRTTNGYFVQVVKLLKAWRDRLPTKSCQLKSYILESLIHKTIGNPSSHAGAIVSVLEGIESSYGAYRGTNIVPAITDPGNPSVTVTKHLPAKEFDDFMIQVKSAAQTARSAFDSKDESTSRKLWRQLFGSQFGQ